MDKNYFAVLSFYLQFTGLKHLGGCPLDHKLLLNEPHNFSFSFFYFLISKIFSCKTKCFFLTKTFNKTAYFKKEEYKIKVVENQI